MSNRFMDLVGTLGEKLQLGISSTAVAIKHVSGVLRVRNKADNADAALVASKLSASGNDIELNEDAAGAGADWLYTLRRPSSGMTAAVVLTLPPDDGSPSQVLQTDGNGVLTWLTVAAGTDKAVVDTTALAFGTSSPLTLFTLPANAAVLRVAIIVDTAFDGTPTVSIGIAGTTSKYMSSTQVDLTQAAASIFEVDPGAGAGWFNRSANRDLRRWWCNGWRSADSHYPRDPELIWLSGYYRT